jgi:hypothetical protein
MRVAVFGSIRWDDDEAIAARLDALPRDGLELLHPEASRGISGVVAAWAQAHAVPAVEYAQDRADGAQAGNVRTGAILDADPGLVLVFRSPGKSGGMDRLIAACRERGLPFEVVRPSPEVRRLARENARLRQVISDARSAIESGAPRAACLRILNWQEVAEGLSD